MRLTPALLAKLRADYPGLRFELGRHDSWDGYQTISYTPQSRACHVLHELAHALLGHRDYPLDIDLLKIERAAWDYARTVLAPTYDIDITTDDAEDSLDTYRDWLHNRSLCPACGSSSLQTSDRSYLCVACQTRWHANDARTCALRRVRLTIK